MENEFSIEALNAEFGFTSEIATVFLYTLDMQQLSLPKMN